MVERGLLRLDGAKKVKLAAYRPIRGEAVYLVVFDKPPSATVAHVRKEVGRFELKEVSARVTARVERKKGALVAGGMKLVNPAGKDLLDRVDRFLEEGRDTLILKGVLSEGPGKERRLTLAAVGLPAKK